MNKVGKMFSAIVLALACIVSTGVMADDQTALTKMSLSQAAQLQAKVSQLESLVQAYGGTISPIELRINQTIGNNNAGKQHSGMRYGKYEVPEAGGGSCTATATVSIPGGTGVTLSATADTCDEAVEMVMAGVNAILGRL